MVPDSASTAFSIYSGVKTNYYTMGFDSSIEVGFRFFILMFDALF